MGVCRVLKLGKPGYPTVPGGVKGILAYLTTCVAVLRSAKGEANPRYKSKIILRSAIRLALTMYPMGSMGASTAIAYFSLKIPSSNRRWCNQHRDCCESFAQPISH